MIIPPSKLSTKELYVTHKLTQPVRMLYIGEGFLITNALAIIGELRKSNYHPPVTTVFIYPMSYLCCSVKILVHYQFPLKSFYHLTIVLN